jgi:hypothetical protein
MEWYNQGQQRRAAHQLTELDWKLSRIYLCMRIIGNVCVCTLIQHTRGPSTNAIVLHGWRNIKCHSHGVSASSPISPRLSSRQFQCPNRNAKCAPLAELYKKLKSRPISWWIILRHVHVYAVAWTAGAVKRRVYIMKFCAKHPFFGVYALMHWVIE